LDDINFWRYFHWVFRVPCFGDYGRRFPKRIITHDSRSPWNYRPFSPGLKDFSTLFFHLSRANQSCISTLFWIIDKPCCIEESVFIGIILLIESNQRFFSKRVGEEPGFKDSRGQGFKGDRKLLIAHSMLSAICDERLAVFT